MLLKIIFSIIAILYLAVNIWTSVCFDPEQMRERYVKGQCNVGKISAAVFYAPAWFTKVFKWAVVRAIK